nr:hypothetical protein [Frigoribacterium sp. RIT-PI-h]
MSGAYAGPDEGRRSVEFDHLVARGEHPRVVRCHDDDGAVVGEFAKQFEDHLGVRVIERCGGFVSEDDPGLVQNEAGQSDSLLLTPTQPGHLRRFDPLQVNSSEGCGSSPGALPRRDPLGRQGDVEVLGDGPAVDETVVLEEEPEDVAMQTSSCPTSRAAEFGALVGDRARCRCAEQP